MWQNGWDDSRQRPDILGEEINLGFGRSRDVVVISRIRLGHCGHRSGLPLTGNPPAV